MRKTIGIFCLTITIWGCSKTNENTSVDDGLFTRKYCNDPEAVNFNHGFPGTPDSSICFYPKDVFAGSYLVKDSIFNTEFELDTVLEKIISFIAVNNSNLKVNGFCPSGDPLYFTADRFYKAQSDSLTLGDSTKLPGQLICSTSDTLIGTINKIEVDTPKIRINWTVASDTGINYHIGTGIKL